MSTGSPSGGPCMRTWVWRAFSASQSTRSQAAWKQRSPKKMWNFLKATHQPWRFSQTRRSVQLIKSSIAEMTGSLHNWRRRPRAPSGWSILPIMCLGVVASDETKKIINPNEKVCTMAYYKVLRLTILPRLKSTSPNSNYSGGQKWATAREKTEKLIFRAFFSTKMWSFFVKGGLRPPLIPPPRVLPPGPPLGASPQTHKFPPPLFSWVKSQHTAKASVI